MWGEVFADLAEGDWQRLNAGPGSKGERGYDWQCLVLAEGADADKGYYLLFRHFCAQPEQWQAYLVWGPPACDVPTLVRVAGSRWRIESAFEMAKQEVGLDEYEARNARGWDRRQGPQHVGAVHGRAPGAHLDRAPAQDGGGEQEEAAGTPCGRTGGRSGRAGRGRA